MTIWTPLVERQELTCGLEPPEVTCSVIALHGCSWTEVPPVALHCFVHPKPLGGSSCVDALREGIILNFELNPSVSAPCQASVIEGGRVALASSHCLTTCCRRGCVRGQRTLRLDMCQMEDAGLVSPSALATVHA